MQDERDPDIGLAGFSMWVDGYQFPDATEYWDANWVVVRVVCLGHRSRVELCEPCIHLPELQRWRDECVRLREAGSDAAELQTIEPYLRIRIDRTGEFRGLVATVRVTPRCWGELHEFKFAIDASYVGLLIESIGVVLARFPVRGR